MTPDLNSIIVAALGALGGGGLTAWLNSRNSSFNMLVTTLKEENNKLGAELQDFKKNINDLQNKIRKQELLLIALESTHYGHPWPSWTKDTEGRYILINKAYEETFLKPNGFSKYSLIGKTDSDIWPENFSLKSRESDLEVLQTRQIVEHLENIPILPLHKDTLTWTIKYPIILNSTIVGIGGSTVPVQQIVKAINKTENEN